LKKLTYNEVKSTFEKEGYKLLSTDYINSKSKLMVKCNNGHIFHIRFNDFQQGHGCRKCAILSNNQKFSYDYIKEQVEKRGYTLLSTDYKNANEKIEMLCNNGHKFQMKYGNFQQGQRCSICNGGIRLSYEYVKNFIENKGYKLLSTEYKNVGTKLKMICDNGHKCNITFNHFQQGHRCPVCFSLQSFSRPEKEIVKFIKSFYNNSILENDRSVIKNPITSKMLELDVYLPDVNKAIEFNGIYWHSSVYACFKDQEKIKQCKEKTIDLLVVDEKNWIQDKQSCLENIRQFILE
jgi:hypothetical protein